MPHHEAAPGRRYDDGSFVRENWLHCAARDPVNSSLEVPLYSDTRIVGERQFGPYTFLNPVPDTVRFGHVVPTLFLRYGAYVPTDEPAGFGHERGDDRYHGGILSDELAALLSLCLGVRLWAGRFTRFFDVDGDPLGRPRNDERPPALTVLSVAPTIPSLAVSASLASADLIEAVPLLSAKDSNVLVRAARSYQRALWVADSDPTQSWILLVSAVEAVGAQWSSAQYDPVQMLRDHKPELCAALTSSGGAPAILEVARAFADQMKSTAKFVRFMKEHCPRPRSKRPHPVAQHAWTDVELESSFRRVYRYRSVALHTGKPFPLPMCEPPWRHSQWDAPEEVMTSERMGAYGGEWTKKSIPMHLHVFEYIVRESLRKWWSSLDKGAP